MKTITLPGFGNLDIAPLASLLHKKELMRMLRISQLGLAELVFPQATHKRYSHQFGVYKFSDIRTCRWVKKEIVTPEEARAIRYAGLLHDTGHKPYSHTLEGLCKQDHKEVSAQLVENLRFELEQRDVDVDMVKRMIVKQHPLSPAVTHRCLGTDKMHYLLYDARHTNEAAVFCWEDLLTNAYCINGKMAIVEQYMEELMQLHETYRRMYLKVYLRKACMVIQHWLQKLVQQAMECDGITEQDLAIMDDGQLNAKLYSCTNAPTRNRFTALMEDRSWPKAAITFAPEGVHPHDRTLRKPTYVQQIPLEMMPCFSALENPYEARKHEQSIARILHIPQEDVLLVPSTNARRFELEDVLVCDGEQNVLGKFEDMRPEHYTFLRDSIKNYLTLRVCVSEPYRESTSRQGIAEKVVGYLMETFCS